MAAGLVSRVGSLNIIFHAIDSLQYAKLNKPQEQEQRGSNRGDR